jgi:peptidoglycan/xylan/chitin deacetylase (PgdA/CDA1 family)
MPRLLLPCLLALLVLPSCKRIEDKLQRLAEKSGAAPAKSEKAEPALTPEQQAIEQKLAESAMQAAAVPEPVITAPATPEINKSATIAILGYHDVRERGGSPMLIAGSKFRQQMQAIKDSQIPVIPLADVMAWKRGEKNIPPESIVITFDDGWEGVYEQAYPVLKEFGFPFTVYLYKKYVNIGGRSMSWDQIREMMLHGCEIGSHSVSHESLKKKPKAGMSDADYQAWVLAELKDSRDFLEQNLKIKITSFAYPYGVFDDEVMNTGLQIGYESLVTVNGQKVGFDTLNGKLGRYIIHGDSDTNFKLATSFRGRGDVSSNKFLLADAKNDKGEPLVILSPAPDSTITQRRPVLEANLKNAGTVIPESVKLRIGGLGIVPATYDPATMTLRYQFPYKLRRDECLASLTFQRDAAQPAEVVNWRFKLDLTAAYAPEAR